MPVPQLTPPGHLDQHSLLVALTPVLLCLTAALAWWVIGGRGGATHRAATCLAAVNLFSALVLQGLFLLPWGPAAAYTEPLAGGLVRVGWWATGTAMVLGVWAAWYWRVWKQDRDEHSARWCLRVALALALPVVAVPALVIAALADANPASGRRCWMASLIVLVASGLIVAMPMFSPDCRWWLYAAPLAAASILAGRGPWGIPLVLASIAAFAS